MALTQSQPRRRPLLVCTRNRECLSRSRCTVIPLTAVRLELTNYLTHGRTEHLDDWYHCAVRTTSGTLSWG